MSKLNLKPRTIFCKDNIDILTGINSNTIDLIYLDPPFNKKKKFTAPIGSAAEGAEFSDIFRQEDIKDEWVKSIEYENSELFNFLNHTKYDGISYNYCYLVYMAIRLVECHRILKHTGSIYLHCDPTMSHYLKIVMDCIFKEKNFMTEIVWSYSWGKRTEKKWNRKHDIILVYTKTDQFTFNADQVLEPRKLQEQSKKRLEYSGALIKDHNKRGKSELALPTDVWHIPTINSMAKERTNYPTQKPIALLERIIKASSKQGDIVLDPFCGCATTCVASEKLDRGWIGVDVSHKAYEYVKARIKKEVPATLFKQEQPSFTTKAPIRGADEAKEIGNVYIISNPAFRGVYKVGIAQNVHNRLNSYQTSDPYRGFKLEYNIETEHFKAIERHIHSKFKKIGQGEHEWVFTENWEDIKQDIIEFENKESKKSK